MKYIILWLLSLCITFSPFGGFSIGVINFSNSVNKNKEPEPVEEPVVEPAVAPVVEPEGRKITLNNTLDLDGYCTIMIPSEYWTLNTEDSTFTKKIVRYKDKKSRIIMSYLVNISDDADIPGYITREAAGLDIVTNSKHNVEYESGTWVVIPAEEVIDNCYCTVYYITSKDETTAFWMRVNRHEDTDEEEFNEVIDTIINSYNMYYIGGTIFDTPTSGFYAENNVDDHGVVSDTTDYKKNTQDNNVWDSDKQGFDFKADISSKWDSMEVIVDDHKLTLPCSLQDLQEADFTPNDTNVKTDTYYIESGASKEIVFSNSKGTMITMTFLNDSNTELKDISECAAVKIDIDTSEFISVINGENGTAEPEEGSEVTNEDNTEESNEETVDTEENSDTNNSDSEDSNEENNTEENNTEENNTEENNTEENNTEENNTEDEDSDSTDPVNVMQGEKEFDNITHSVILPKGIMLNVYTQDIIDSYGEPNDRYRSESKLVYTWKKDGKYMTLECGAVKNIKHITLSTMENK